MWVGVDVGLRRLHAVAIDGRGRVLLAHSFPPEQAVERLRQADGVAVDSPGDWSTAPHAGDPTVSRKFRLGRCSEIDLGRRFGIWVPWSTPPEPTSGTWMATGVALFAALRAAGHDPVEAYPHGAFRVLAGTRLPKKTTIEGRSVRAALLRAAGVEVEGLEHSHDLLDAAVVAVVARDRALGSAQVAGCGHDASGIWLPAGPCPATSVR